MIPSILLFFNHAGIWSVAVVVVESVDNEPEAVVVEGFVVDVVVADNNEGMVVVVVTGVDNLIDGVVVAVVVAGLIEGMLGLVVEGIENLVEGVEVLVRGFVVAENEGNNEVGVVDATLDVAVVSFEVFKVLGAIKKYTKYCGSIYN